MSERLDECSVVGGAALMFGMMLAGVDILTVVGGGLYLGYLGYKMYHD